MRGTRNANVARVGRRRDRYHHGTERNEHRCQESVEPEMRPPAPAGASQTINTPNHEKKESPGTGTTPAPAEIRIIEQFSPPEFNATAIPSSFSVVAPGIQNNPGLPLINAPTPQRAGRLRKRPTLGGWRGPIAVERFQSKFTCTGLNLKGPPHPGPKGCSPVDSVCIGRLRNMRWPDRSAAST
jgi:hypothetical protein